jgi:hypothetical protein
MCFETTNRRINIGRKRKNWNVFLLRNGTLIFPENVKTYISIIIITISCMQGICTYIPETNNVPKKYNVAAIVSLLFMVPISLAAALALMYFYVSTFRSMCAVFNMALFCSSLTLWFPGMVLNLLLLLLLLVKILSHLCRVFIHIFLRQTLSLSNTVLQPFCRYCLWCPYH